MGLKPPRCCARSSCSRKLSRPEAEQSDPGRAFAPPAAATAPRTLAFRPRLTHLPRYQSPTRSSVGDVRLWHFPSRTQALSSSGTYSHETGRATVSGYALIERAQPAVSGRGDAPRCFLPVVTVPTQCGMARQTRAVEVLEQHCLPSPPAPLHTQGGEPAVKPQLPYRLHRGATPDAIGARS